MGVGHPVSVAKFDHLPLLKRQPRDSFEKFGISFLLHHDSAGSLTVRARKLAVDMAFDRPFTGQLPVLGSTVFSGRIDDIAAHALLYPGPALLFRIAAKSSKTPAYIKHRLLHDIGV